MRKHQHLHEVINPLPSIRRLINKYSDKRRFFARVTLHFGQDTPDYLLIKKAWEIAGQIYQNKKRDNGEPQFSHQRSIAIIIMEHKKLYDAGLIAAAFYHDLVEDFAEWTYERVAAEANEDVAHLVDAVTKPRREDFASSAEHNRAIFLKVETAGYRAIILKCSDRLQNMLTLYGSYKKRVKKIIQTFEYVLPIAMRYDVLWHELSLAATYQCGRLLVQPHD